MWLLSSGTTIGRTTGRLLPGLLLRCHFPQIRPSVSPSPTPPGHVDAASQVRPSVVPLPDHCLGRCSDAAFFRYDHRSYPRQTAARAGARYRFLQVRPSVYWQTAARAAAQMPLSAGTTIGRTTGRPLPGLQLCYRFLQVRPSVVPRQTAARAAAQMPLSSGTTIGRTPADRCPGRCSDAAFRRYDHRSYHRQTAARAAALLPLSSGTTIGRTPSRPPSRLQLRYRFL